MLVMAGSAIALEKLSGPEIHRSVRGQHGRRPILYRRRQVHRMARPDGHAMAIMAARSTPMPADDAERSRLLLLRPAGQAHGALLHGASLRRIVHPALARGRQHQRAGLHRQGQPREPSDRGKPWICDGLISQAPMTPRAGRQMAAWTPRPARSPTMSADLAALLAELRACRVCRDAPGSSPAAAA